MKKLITIATFLFVMHASAQSWLHVAHDNGSVTTLTGITSTTAGNLNVLVVIPVASATPYPLTTANVSDNKSQSWALDGCSTGDVDPYICIFYVCSGTGGVTSITLSGIGVTNPHEIYFAEGSGALASGCKGNFITNSSTSVSTVSMSATKDENSELAIMGIGCNGNIDEGTGITGSVTWGNISYDAGNAIATAIESSTSPVTVTNGASSQCFTSVNSNPNFWTGAVALFLTSSLAPGTDNGNGVKITGGSISKMYDGRNTLFGRNA